MLDSPNKCIPIIITRIPYCNPYDKLKPVIHNLSIHNLSIHNQLFLIRLQSPSK